MAKTEPDGKLPDHIDPETKLAKGVDPEVGIVAVNRAVLIAKHGDKKGGDLYRKLAVAGGFYDPNIEPVGSNYFPDLSLDGMDKTARAKVDAILKEV